MFICRRVSAVKRSVKPWQRRIHQICTWGNQKPMMSPHLRPIAVKIHTQKHMAVQVLSPKPDLFSTCKITDLIWLDNADILASRKCFCRSHRPSRRLVLVASLCECVQMCKYMSEWVSEWVWEHIKVNRLFPDSLNCL